MAQLKNLIVNGVSRFIGKVYGSFVGDLTGNVTGDVSGSSGSCTGNAATATSATSATTASKLGTDAGSTTQPVYFSDGVPVATSYSLSTSVPSGAKFTDTTYSAGTGISLSGTTFSNSGVRSITTGSSNGTISVNTNGTAAEVAVKGLGSAAYTASTAYAAASHTHSYAGSSSAGGAATSANKINTDAGSATQPVYFSDGIPVATTYSLSASVPSGAKFTDTTYSAGTGISLSGTTFSNSGVRSIATGTSNGTISVNTNGTSANVAVYGLGTAAYTASTAYAAASHTHSYAGSSSAGGAATSANKINTDAGSATQPVYFSNGVPVATTYSLSKSVPSTAVFTDTTYSAGTGISLSGTTFSNSGVRSIATGSSNGTISVNTNGTAAEVAVKGLGSAAYTASTAYAAASHTHTKSQITDFPSSMPASDVYAWAKASTKPSYAFSEITSRGEAYLAWGGKNLSGSYGPIDAAMISDLGANRLAFMPAAGVTVEYTRDGGTTWTDYGSSNASKIDLFDGNGTSLVIGKADSTNKATANGDKYQLRITLTTNTAQVYTALNKFAIYVSTNGSSSCTCTITARTKANYDAGSDTWTTFANGIGISGWSGWNILNTSAITTYGNQTSQFINVRFLFKANGGDTSYVGLTVQKILGFGGVGWTTPSTMASKGRMYTYDYSKNVTFPNKVTATSFAGALTGNVTGNVSGSSGSCTGNAATATSATTASKLGTDAGSATQPVYFSSGVPVATTYSLAKSVPSTAVFTDTTYSAGTGISLSGTTFSNSGVRSISTGSSNGTISVNTNGTSADVSVKGLGSAAYTASTAYAAASHNHAAGNITSGTLAVARGGTGATTLAPAVGTYGARAIAAGTTDLTAGTSSLTTGQIYCYYV